MISPKSYHHSTNTFPHTKAFNHSMPKPHTRSAARESPFLSLSTASDLQNVLRADAAQRSMLMDMWANLRCKRNHIIVQSDRRRGGLKMSSILYLHQAAFIHTTQCQILLMFRCSSLCERPTTSPTKEPHSKYTTKIYHLGSQTQPR